MGYRVAIASTDGKMVNQHFGRAEVFHIVEIHETGQFHYLESRSVPACCHRGEHEADGFDAVLSRLQDVQAVIVSKIGTGAADYLEQKGLVVYEAPYPIKPLLEKIAKDQLYNVDHWRGV